MSAGLSLCSALEPKQQRMRVQIQDTCPMMLLLLLLLLLLLFLLQLLLLLLLLLLLFYRSPEAVIAS